MIEAFGVVEESNDIVADEDTTLRTASSIGERYPSVWEQNAIAELVLFFFLGGEGEQRLTTSFPAAGGRLDMLFVLFDNFVRVRYSQVILNTMCTIPTLKNSNHTKAVMLPPLSSTQQAQPRLLKLTKLVHQRRHLSTKLQHFGIDLTIFQRDDNELERPYGELRLKRTISSSGNSKGRLYSMDLQAMFGGFVHAIPNSKMNERTSSWNTVSYANQHYGETYYIGKFRSIWPMKYYDIDLTMAFRNSNAIPRGILVRISSDQDDAVSYHSRNDADGLTQATHPNGPPLDST